MNSVTISVEEYNRLRDDNRELKKSIGGFWVSWSGYGTGRQFTDHYSPENEKAKEIMKGIEETVNAKNEKKWEAKFAEWKKEYEAANPKKKGFWF